VELFLLAPSPVELDQAHAGRAQTGLEGLPEARSVPGHRRMGWL
jgi:hypothetical protein